MLEFLDEQKGKAQSLMQKLLNASEKDIEKASLRDKMGALKILSEVFAPKNEEAERGGVRVIVEGKVQDLSEGAPDD